MGTFGHFHPAHWFVFNVIKMIIWISVSLCCIWGPNLDKFRILTVQEVKQLNADIIT